MGVYKYGGQETVEAELERLRQEKEAAKDRIRARNTLLQQLRREQRRLEKLHADEARVETQIRSIATTPKELPPPRYGGRAGLRAAAAEAYGHDPKRHARKDRAA